MNVAVDGRVWEKEEERANGRGGRLARDGLNTQQFWSLQNKAPE